MDCAICLNHIERQQEAYLYPCTHFFCFKCIQEWTERQRQHDADEDCPPGQRCHYACPLCKAPYTYIVYECIGSSFRLLPTCGQPKTMSAMPLSPDQSRRRALYVTPAQLTPARPVPIAKRLRLPHDAETRKFVHRELQAVLLTEDVDIIVQHLTGVLQSLAKKQQGSTKAIISSPNCSTLYGNQEAFVAQVSEALGGFLGQHSEGYAQQLWLFLHSGLTVAAFDRLVFETGSEADADAPAAAQEIQQDAQPADEGQASIPDW